MFSNSQEKLIGKPITVRPSLLDENTILRFIMDHAKGNKTPAAALRSAWHFYWTVVQVEGLDAIADYMSKYSFEAMAEAGYRPVDPSTDDE